jgi:hypothetical protein
VGLYRYRTQKLRMLLTHRKLLRSKAIGSENELCDRRKTSQTAVRAIFDFRAA